MDIREGLTFCQIIDGARNKAKELIAIELGLQQYNVNIDSIKITSGLESIK